MVGLTLIVVAFFLAAVNLCGVEPVIRFPGGFAIDLGVLTTTFSVAGTTISVPWLYLVFVFLLLAGMSNAVNLTDGLVGLAGGTVMIAMLVMAAICFLRGDANLAIFCAACAGGCLGFLWFNAYPASIFMGDTGSLALGAGFAAVAVLTNTEVISLVVGGLFIVEALSVIIQVVSFKATGKRVFLMAPIHHHFEKLGWAETKVVIRFWIIAAAGPRLLLPTCIGEYPCHCQIDFPCWSSAREPRGSMSSPGPFAIAAIASTPLRCTAAAPLRLRRKPARSRHRVLSSSTAPSLSRVPMTCA